jgi:adenosine deaminase
VALPSTNYDELKDKIYVGEDCTSLVDYLRAFDITLSVLQKPCTHMRTALPLPCEPVAH